MKVKDVIVSVPYRGATFLNDKIRSGDYRIPFPSPIGELHFSIINHVLHFREVRAELFPSPIGELHFSIL